jgi:hypothetical protein
LGLCPQAPPHAIHAPSPLPCLPGVRTTSCCHGHGWGGTRHCHCPSPPQRSTLPVQVLAYAPVARIDRLTLPADAHAACVVKGLVEHVRVLSRVEVSHHTARPAPGCPETARETNKVHLADHLRHARTVGVPGCGITAHRSAHMLYAVQLYTQTTRPNSGLAICINIHKEHSNTCVDVWDVAALHSGWQVLGGCTE